MKARRVLALFLSAVLLLSVFSAAEQPVIRFTLKQTAAALSQLSS